MKKVFILLFILAGIFIYTQVNAKSPDPKTFTGTWIRISATDSRLYLMSDQTITKSYPVSIAKNGTGNVAGSNKTPLGLHEIKKKFGKSLPQNSILKARVPTGKLAKIISQPIATNTDLVTSRILWLSGLEKGYNKGGKVDSYNRFIYIHGTPEEGLIGRPSSHGCIRMYNKDVIELFDLVPTGTKVLIEK